MIDQDMRDRIIAEPETLLDDVLELYEGIRADGEPERAWGRWRETRDELFRTHPQSPLPVADREGFDRRQGYGTG